MESCRKLCHPWHTVALDACPLLWLLTILSLHLPSPGPPHPIREHQEPGWWWWCLAGGGNNGGDVGIWRLVGRIVGVPRGHLMLVSGVKIH